MFVLILDKQWFTLCGPHYVYACPQFLNSNYNAVVTQRLQYANAQMFLLLVRIYHLHLHIAISLKNAYADPTNGTNWFITPPSQFMTAILSPPQLWTQLAPAVSHDAFAIILLLQFHFHYSYFPLHCVKMEWLILNKYERHF